MRNKLLVSLLSLLTVFILSGLATAQDPGPPDVLTVVCGSPIYDGAGCDLVQFDVMLNTDNAGDNITALGQTYLVSGANICAPGIGDSACAFTGSALVTAGFDILSLGVVPVGPDYQVTFGAVDFGGGLGTGNHLLYHFCVFVDDTGTICIDSSSTPTTPWSQSIVTASTKAYAPVYDAPTCCLVGSYQNHDPLVVCGGDADFIGEVLSAEILANDPDDPADQCDQIETAEFYFLDRVTGDPGPVNTAPCGSASLSAFVPGPAVSSTFSWNTVGCTDADTGCYRVVFTFTDNCGGSGADTCEFCLLSAPPCPTVQIGEVTGDPGQTVEVPVFYFGGRFALGGFSFCIEFANADLTAITVRRGDLIDDVDPQYNNKFKWHYFTFRLNPSTVIHKYKVCVIGIGKAYSSYPGYCIPAGTRGVLFYIKFVLANNELFRCHDTRLCFEWDDWTCTENSLSDCTGNDLYVSNDTLEFNPRDCDTLDKHIIHPCVDFICGRVIWRCGHDVDPIIIGDINVNGYPNEIADAVLFASYFISGIGVFDPNPETRMAQVGATDINQDGYTLSVADLVYLLRILTGDQAPLGAALNSSAVAKVDFINGRMVQLSTTEALGAIVFTFKGEGQIVPIVEGLRMDANSANGETRVIVWTLSKNNKVESGNLFSVKGDLQLVGAEAATWNAQPINVEVMGGLPKAFSLSQNNPNPFNATTQISFALPQAGNVTLKIYNVAGQLVKSYSQYMDAGNKTITWDGMNSRGDAVASGIYFYRLDVEKQFSKTLKMTLLK